MMAPLMFSILLGAAAPGGSDGLAMVKRVVKAIHGETEYWDSDFVHPLRASEKATLHGFATCRTDSMFYILKPVPGEQETYVEDENNVFVLFACKGVPTASAVAMSIHLKDGKIAKIETHNADLVRKP